jgi:CRISPR system Cascade subunit CasA
MPFNLIDDPWLPVRRLSGGRETVRPGDLTSGFVDDPMRDPILALDFPRPDWNAAVTELLIGLLAVVMPPVSTDAWAESWAKPPPPDELHQRLTALAFAFNLDGDGARCFQDVDPLADMEAKPVTALLIDAPGENAEKKNTDLFVKRAAVQGLCPAYAAAALITLQTYAPAGGQGNRTSMRGGGPLTTLPMPRRWDPGRTRIITTLWDLVWASVPDKSAIGAAPTDAMDPAWAKIFPWLAATRSSEKDRATTPEHGHFLQQFFGMPRRIRLDVDRAGEDFCALAGPPAALLVRSFRQKNYGVKYDGWEHPLSPHRADNSGKIPFHPQPGGATFRDWLTWIETPANNKTQRAACLDSWNSRLKCLIEKSGPIFDDAEVWQSSVLAVGFDMDNMKSRAWLEARIPYFDVPIGKGADQWPQEFLPRAHNLVDGTDAAETALRSQIKIAMTGKLNREGRYRAAENLPKDAYADLKERLWRTTEPAFRDSLKLLRAAPLDADGAIREAFLRILRNTAFQFFDEITGTDDLADQDARRIVIARSQLGFAFNATGDVRKGLGIMTEEAKLKVKDRKSKKKEATA